MTATFDGLGFKFLYPEGWDLQKEETGDWPRTVSVHSPTGAFVSMTLYERPDAPTDLLDKTLAALRDEYSDAEIYRIASSVPGFEHQDTYEANYYCLDFLVTARVCQFEAGDFVLLTMYQGESRDFDKLVPVFDAIVMNSITNFAKH